MNWLTLKSRDEHDYELHKWFLTSKRFTK